MTQEVVYPGECSIFIWEESVFFIWVECPEVSVGFICYSVRFKACMSLIFCFDDLSIGASGVLKSPAIVVLLSISPFISVSVCLIYQGAPILSA